ncbi:MAG: sulfotransferase, partial [Gammaproteobacteria bacterium]|nr:sulfotransferase [Gammaproteobacteria bacterium]
IQRYISPGFQKAHPLTAERPDECLHLFENSAFSSMAFFLTEAKSYAWWLLEQDNRPAYAFYKQQLQLLQWLRPGRRWVLKWPYHLWHLDALFDVFPDARVIHLHRDPVQAVPSVCNLSVLARQSFCEAIDHHALGQFWLDYCEAGLQRSLRQQKNVLHIEYGELVEQPQAALEAIFKFTALDGKKITPPEKSNKQTANSSASRYSLEKFGLTPTDVKQKMKEY